MILRTVIVLVSAILISFAIIASAHQGDVPNNVIELSSEERVQTGTRVVHTSDPNQSWRLERTKNEPQIEFSFALKEPIVQTVTREEASKYQDPGWTIYDSGGREILVSIDIPLGMRRQVPGVYEIRYVAYLRGTSPSEGLATATRTCTVEDLNQCKDGTADCSIHANCIHLDTGGYRCECKPGYRGNGKTCVDINECLEGTANCGMHSYCLNTPGSYECHCNPGFFMNEHGICEDINECETGQHNCHQFATCINIPGSFECKCKPGYIGDGKDCSPINKCTSGEMNCHPYADCIIKGENQFSCQCKSGFRGDGVSHCDDIDECAEGIAVCPEHSYCVNTFGGYTCACERGFEMKDDKCVDIDECAEQTHTCPPDSTCYNSIGSFHCTCNEGFEMDEGRNICVDVAGAPKLRLSGNAFVEMDQFDTWSEPGFELEDEKDEISLVVDTPRELNGIAKECGVFVITYSADDRSISRVTTKTRTVKVNEVNVCKLDSSSPFSHQCHPFATCHFLVGKCDYECHCPTGYYGDGFGPDGCRDSIAPIFKYFGEDRYEREVCQVCGTALAKPDLRDPIITEAYDNTYHGRVDVSDRIRLRTEPSEEIDCLEHYYTVSDVDGNTATKHITVCLRVEDMYTLIKDMERLYLWLVFVIRSTVFICLAAFVIFLLWEFGYVLSAITRVVLSNNASHDDKDIAYTIWYRLLHPTYSRRAIRELVNLHLYPIDDDDSAEESSYDSDEGSDSEEE